MTSNKLSHQDRGRSRVRDEFLFLLVGGGIGAGLALLFAPKTGAELRGDISEIARKGYDDTVEKAQLLKEKSDGYFRSIKEKADKAYDLAADKLSQVRDNLDPSVKTGEKTSDGENGKSTGREAGKSSGLSRRTSSIV